MRNQGLTLHGIRRRLRRFKYEAFHSLPWFSGHLTNSCWQAKYNTKNQHLQSELASLKGFEDELQGLEEEIQQCTTLVKEASSQVDKSVEELEACKQELAGAQRTIKKLEKDYDWVVEESP